MRSFLICMALASLVAALYSCNGKNIVAHSTEDRLLAQVYNKTLHLSDMEGMIPEGVSSEDSSLIINAFVRNWVREASLLHEAENNIPRGLDIDQLVEDYRASLVKNNYENILVNKLLDSMVTQEQLQEFYEKNKEQYQLETPIIRCRFIKAPKDAPQLGKAQDLWNSNKFEDLLELTSWCKKHATIQNLQDSVWYKVEDIAAYMPRGVLTVDNVGYRKDFIQRDDNFMYFFKVLELVSRKEIAPLSYIEDQARKVILHKRKTQLLEETKDKLYDEALRKNNIKVFQ
ncbi:MAG: peptidyl-prolyl cis-trans isomerase [Lewinellaceae bacterium]|nr:peptidyl-prolyl cis-trans isomerase [Saprospiraceae bacterium]MCB9340246.1 peptidyl-prolyl cis-trans isomerase [Lewinellaceae bacterium]